MDRRDLGRLGHHIVSCRVALGFRNRTDLADSLQFTVRTLADIEHDWSAQPAYPLSRPSSGPVNDSSV
jgi:hypothetical protein